MVLAKNSIKDTLKTVLGVVILVSIPMFMCTTDYFDNAIFPELTYYENQKNAETAYEWAIEYHNYTNIESPCCSAQAREWVIEYREYHNLTRDEFPCFVWCNDMENYWADY